MNSESKLPEEIGSGDPTPEQLLQILELQSQARRSQSAATNRNRAMILVVGIVFILLAAGAALLVLEQMLSGMRPDPEHTAAATPAEVRNK